MIRPGTGSVQVRCLLYTISDSVQTRQAAPTGQRPGRLSYFIRVVSFCNCPREAIPEFNTLRAPVMCSLPGMAMLGLRKRSSNGLKGYVLIRRHLNMPGTMNRQRGRGLFLYRLPEG